MTLCDWDPDSLPDNFSLAIVAKRRSGKSTLLKYLCWKHWRRQFPFVYVFTETLYNEYYQDFIPQGNIFPGYNEAKINQIIQRQIDLKNIMSKFPKKDRENIDTLIILDDVMEVKYSNSLQKLLLQGRHLDISLCMALQDACLIDRLKRDQLDCVISMRQANKVSRERIVLSYLAVNTVQEGDDVIKEATSDAFSMLVIDNTTNDYALDKFCYKFKLPALPPQQFSMGHTKNYTWLYETELGETETIH